MDLLKQLTGTNHNQIFFDTKKFVEKVQRHMEGKNKDLPIPRIRKKSVAKSLAEYEAIAESEVDAIVREYASRLSPARSRVTTLGCTSPG